LRHPHSPYPEQETGVAPTAFPVCQFSRVNRKVPQKVSQSKRCSQRWDLYQ